MQSPLLRGKGESFCHNEAMRKVRAWGFNLVGESWNWGTCGQWSIAATVKNPSVSVP